MNNTKRAKKGGKARWENISKEERSAYASKIAKLKWANKTKKEKSDYGKMMVEARIKKYGQKRT